MTSLARVRPDVSGTVQHGNNFLALIPGDEWPADHPCVVAHSDLFDVVTSKPTKEK